MTAKVIKTRRAQLTPKFDTAPVTVLVDDSARLHEIRQLVQFNNKSSLDENLVICQIYMESRFDANATVAGSTAKGLMQMNKGAVQQVYKYRKQQELGHMPSDLQTHQAFAEGAAMHVSSSMFDEATNIQLGTEYMQYWIDKAGSLEEAYKLYRGLSNGVYYKKIRACAEKLKADPGSMQPLRDMAK
ncbi:transglycosylase SLT domain-containing protein [Paraburkholderia silvatlantica]|uniref:Soluble lytic murein transglycosylase-like protein n=1 Tax=Paraburkholderia silvatlantica TaxID=321895 RepID=A0ABR6FHQ9_9BURK|nr:transglycosylase SLT domain-containing protein [Paraburkholderia silvatlantica]MBB2926962.1 soluble lytic murein transglycosylase-like protein [Paraburkholderia silvatlantica]PVY37415.1 transglycosylase-like protein with SLT domain [Paraburkholderia silvatlantica]PXW42377.1 transglycosylase-like protein with SLT domain [Paraburkholderia silvatlantica]